MTIKKIMGGGKKSYKPFEDCLEKIKKPKELKVTEFKPFGSIPIISQEINFISGYTNDENFRFCAPRDLVIFGDHTRVLKYIDFDFAVGADGVKILVPKSFLSVKYFYYFLKWCNVDNLGYSRHYKLLKEIKVYVPPMEVQEEIVKELDLINRLLEIKQEEIKQLDLLSQSIFYSMFGDPITNENNFPIAKLGDVCTCKNSNIVASKMLDANGGGEKKYPLFGASGFVRNIDFCQQTKPYIGVVKDGAIGKVDIFPANSSLIGTMQYILPNEKTNLSFLKYILQNLHLEKYSQGAVIPHIYFRVYKNEKILLPPMEEQKRFAEKIEKIEELKVKAKKQIEDIKEMLNYSMDKYFG